MKGIYFHPTQGLVVAEIDGNNIRVIEKADWNDVASEARIWTNAFIDLYAFCPDPGYEYREDITTFAASAKHGGFSVVFVRPDTKPVLDNGPAVREFLQRGRQTGVDIRPMPAISIGLEGRQLSQMGDMKDLDLPFVSNGEQPVESDMFLRRVMEYASNFGFTLSITPYHKDLHTGRINDSKMSAILGMSANPWVEEAIAVARYIFWAEFTGARIHITKVTTRQAIELIRNAKAKGINVTASVPFYSLLFTEDDMATFDENLLTQPVLRSKDDQDAIIDGLVDGTIDAIVSDHTPVAMHEKALEIEYAHVGMIGLDVMVPALFEQVKKGGIPYDVVIRALTTGPAKVASIQVPQNLIQIDLESSWTVDSNTIKSKSFNTPFMNRTLSVRLDWLDD